MSELPSNIPARRGCDVCGSSNVSVIFEQRFATFDEGSTFDGYTVVSCTRCGFVYADGIPAQAEFDRYYREMSKYDESAGLSAAELPHYRDVVASVAERLPDRAARLLDVGSASGDMLALFREIGFTNLTGFDPAPRCAEIARERHSLRVINTPISQMPFAGEEFDVIMLTGVLEHLRDLRTTIDELRRLLSPSGAFWFGVPDARRFIDCAESPFQHFSLEHINFFTLQTLEALLASAGFALVDAWETVHNHGSMPEPVLNAVFRATQVKSQPAYDSEGPAAVRLYAEASQRLEDELADRVGQLARERTPVIVWGTGSLTLHLLANERFHALNIVAFVDGNANYWNKTIAGVPVIAPGEVSARPETILVISYSFENEITARIRDVYRLPNPVVKLFGAIELYST